MISASKLLTIAGRRAKPSNAKSLACGLKLFGEGAGLTRPARLAHFLGQVMHETGGLKWDRELWGPTPAQARYDTRTDLGNSPAVDGDGYLYRGRGAFQLTGRANYRDFTAYARGLRAAAPDFEVEPDRVNDDPWEALSAIWYWTSRNLGPVADRNDIGTITRKINGGMNGFDDRCVMYGRAALGLLRFDPIEMREFQVRRGLIADGITGPLTRGALHRALRRLEAPPLRKKRGPRFLTNLTAAFGGLFHKRR